MKITISRPIDDLELNDPNDPFGYSDRSDEDDSEDDSSEEPELEEFEVRVTRRVSCDQDFVYECEAVDEEAAIAMAQDYARHGDPSWYTGEPYDYDDEDYEVE